MAQAVRVGQRLAQDVPVPEAVQAPNIDILAVDEALAQLANKYPDKAELVKLRYFAGLTLSEAATVLGISRSPARQQEHIAAQGGEYCT